MTPFGKKLSELMLEVGARQKELVDVTGLSATHISQIINGRKGPPSAEKLEKIIRHLRLTETEALKLRTAAGKSSRTLCIPEYAKPEEYFVAHELCAILGNMLPSQIVAIREIIKLGNKAN